MSAAWKAAAALAKIAGKGILNGLKKLTAGIFGMSKATKKSNGSLGSNLKMLLKYGLGIRSTFVLFNRMRNAIKEGFSNLAQFSSPVNASISSLMSALTQLKNSFATTFAPVLSVVAPILTTFINLVSRAVTTVGMLIATLTGAKSFTRATAVQQDYAASLEGSAGAAKDAAKEQQKYLSGLDEVRTFTEKNDSSGGGGGGGGGLSPSDMFEEVEIPSKFGDIAQMIKDAWANADFTEIGTLIGTKLSGALDSIQWDSIQNKCSRVAQSIGTFINGFVATPGLWQKVGSTIGQGINTAVGMWNTFFDTTKFQPIGQAIATAANNAITTIDAGGLGRAITQKIQAGIEIAYGFVTTFDWTKFGTKAGEMLNGAFHNVDFTMAAQALSGGIIGALNSLTATMQEFDWRGLGQRVQEFLVNIDWAGIFSALSATIRTAFAGLGEFFGGLFEGVGTSIKTWWDEEIKGQDWKETAGNLLTAIGEGFADIGNWVMENVINPFCNALLGEDKWQEIKKAGEDIVNGFTQGIKDFWSDPFGWIKENIVDPFVNGFKKLFGINSPSTVMEEQGGYVMQGLLLGIIGAIPNLTQALANIANLISQKWDAIKSATNAKWQIIKNGLTTTWSAIKSAANGDWSQINSIVSNSMSTMLRTASSISSSLRNTFSNAFSGLVNSARSTFSSVSSYLSSLWDSVKSWASSIGNKIASIGRSTSSISSISAAPNTRVASVPEAPTPRIPYLASGAVIPPRAAFLAVLGDQKNGNNLEMPESLLRRVVREESGSSGFSGTIRIPLYINGRQVMEAVLEEAQLKQMISGRNPFEMA